MAPILDPLDQRIKLLSEGMEITPSFISRLSIRGVDSVILSQRDLAILNAFSPQGRRTKVPPAHEYVQSNDANDYSKAVDKHVESSGSLTITPSEEPLSDWISKANRLCLRRRSSGRVGSRGQPAHRIGQ